ncbi:MAG TPA: DUF1499 domain-containing protein [Thermoanaerobaculia bacterium]|nr:DUF1499 domain-containing protein [Thermoanaerobaculia bacterium]
MTSVVALAAPLIGLAGLLLFVLGVVAARFSWLPPLPAFLLAIGVGLVLCGALALVFGIVGIVRTLPATHRTGAPQAWAGALMGAGMLLSLYLLSPAGGTVPIHDISTDLSDPPRYDALARASANRDRDLSYPHGPADTAELQREHYPDIVTIDVNRPPAETLARVEDAARALGWTMVEVDEASGRIEAYDTTSLFRFVDDVVVRVRPADGGGSLVDVRSTSRVGQSDLGANAERIRALRDELLD